MHNSCTNTTDMAKIAVSRTRWQLCTFFIGDPAAAPYRVCLIRRGDGSIVPKFGVIQWCAEAARGRVFFNSSLETNFFSPRAFFACIQFHFSPAFRMALRLIIFVIVGISYSAEWCIVEALWRLAELVTCSLVSCPFI